MTVNGEFKALWGMSMIVLVYLVYMLCTPDPEDGTLMLAVVAPIVAIVTRSAVRARILKKGVDG